MIFEKERGNWSLLSALSFIIGCIFYFSYPDSFRVFAFESLILLASCLFLLSIGKRSWCFRALLFPALILLGAFYSHCYDRIFIASHQFEGKAFVDVIGKIESLKETRAGRVGVVLKGLKIYQAKYEKSKNHKKVHKKKIHPKKNYTRKAHQNKAQKHEIEKSSKVKIKSDQAISQEQKPKKPRYYFRRDSLFTLFDEYFVEDLFVMIGDNPAPIKKKRGRKKKCELENSVCSKEDVEKTKQKNIKHKPKSQKKIEKNYMNLAGFMDIDREYLDYKSAQLYRRIEWKEEASKLPVNSKAGTDRPFPSAGSGQALRDLGELGKLREIAASERLRDDLSPIRSLSLPNSPRSLSLPNSPRSLSLPKGRSVPASSLSSKFHETAEGKGWSVTSLATSPKNVMLHPPRKIWISMAEDKFGGANLAVNDQIAIRIWLEEASKPLFKEEFDFALYNKIRGIDATSFATSKPIMLRKNEISNFEEFFLSLREKIRKKIDKHLVGDEAAIAKAFLIGDQTGISTQTNQAIIASGLSHLMSISGFHLSLAGAIFFAVARRFLSYSQFLNLRFSIRKIASVAAVIASLLYLEIAGSPPPAQRAFIMLLIVAIGFLLDEKIHAKRLVIIASLIMILHNPLILFAASFQLSVVATLAIASLHGSITSFLRRHIAYGFVKYFVEILIMSLVIQIATIPLLLRHFHAIAPYSLIANLAAIPLASFAVMPVGFLSLFLMIFGLEKYPLMLMKYGVIAIEKVAMMVSSLDDSYLQLPQINDLGLFLGAFGVVFFFVVRSCSLRIIATLMAFSSIFFTFPKPEYGIYFPKNDRFFVVYDKKEGLVFSRQIRSQKKIEAWSKYFGVSNYKILNSCQKNQCLVKKGDRNFLILFGRAKVNELCLPSKLKNQDVIVNLSKHYKLASCTSPGVVKIDNLDFLKMKEGFIFFGDSLTR